MIVRLLAVASASLIVISCASQKSLWVHSKHGELDWKHPLMVSDREACGVEVYSKGITMDGNLYTNRKEVLTKVMMDSIERNKTGSKVEPEYWSTLNSLEKEVGICIQGKGWSPKK